MREIILGIRMCEWEKDLSGLQKIVNFNNLNNLTPPKGRGRGEIRYFSTI